MNRWKNGAGTMHHHHVIETREAWEQQDPNLKEEVEGPGGQKPILQELEVSECKC